MALRTLMVDLKSGAAQREHLPEQIEHDYLGGRGAVAWMLLNRLPPDTPPLAAENLLVFAAGPLAGTDSFATGGFVVGTRSPLTGCIGYGWAQGHWGAALRRAGCDLLALTGQAEQWSYLCIDDSRVEVRAAAQLLGLDTFATVTTLQAELGADYTILCVGPAAEADVAYATIVAEGRYMAEPAGTGAIMAHKRIKAIAVRGTGSVPVHDERKLHAALDMIRRRVETSPTATGFRQLGSTVFLHRALELGALTELNGQDGKVSVGLQQARAALVVRGKREHHGCAGCPMPCYHDYVRPTLPLPPQPELELVAGFARCDITRPDTLITLAERCLRLGLDPVTTSASIAYLMECQQEGLHRADNLPWGNDAAVLEVVSRMATRQEKRDFLTLGVGEMQEIFLGGDAFAPQVKGLAMPALDPRALNGVALAMATSAIGGDFRYAMNYEELIAEPPGWLPEASSGPTETKSKAVRLIWHERFAAILDSAGLCRRLALMAYQVSPGELVALISGATGVTLAGPDFARLGERIVTTERAFARRFGDNEAPDGLPERWRNDPLAEGRAAGHLPPLDELLADYYRRHGWSAKGDIPRGRLIELGIAPE